MQMESQVLQVNIDDIIPNRFQPRLAFDEQGLKELAASIKEHGIIQPLVLRKLGSKYEIIAGERRYKAATMAGLTTVPAVISNIDDNSSAEVALVENIQRRDLTPIEEAKSYKNLLDKGYLTQEQLAKKMGISQSSIANKLRLLNLANEVQQALLEGKISERHARALLTLDTAEEQVEWLNKIINNRLTVRQLDQELKKAKEKKEESTIPIVNINPNIDDIKQKAFDINSNNKKNIPNMMVPDDVLTDYSELSTSTSSNPQPTFIDSTPLDAIPQPENNKFFANIDDIVGNDDNKFETLNQDIVASQPKKDLEIFGADNNNSNNTTFNNDYETLDINDDNSIELKPNNKFFTAAPKKEENDISSATTTEFDPMQLVGATSSSLGENEEPFAASQIKDLISKLQTQGITINYNESDNGSSYQIVINIEK